jgi:hypothetical protein
MRTAKLLPAIMLLLVSITASAQDYNPFKSIGKKGKILTLSKGKYVEVFDYDTIQRIGTVLFNIRTKKIVKLLNAEETYKKFSDNSSSSRWFSPDPMSEKFYSWSPYNFVYNNPIRYTDPDGTTPGDFYDQQGNYLGTDGVKDQKVYVVTNQKEVTAAQQTTKNGQNLDANKMTSEVQLPTENVRGRMGDAVTRANNPSTAAGDTKGGTHEEGGYYGKNANGQEVTIDAKPGTAYVAGNNGVGVNPTQPADQYNSQSAWRSQDKIEGTFHVHPKGDATVQFVQPPSGADLRNSVSRSTTLGATGNSYVLAAGNSTVYVYKNVGGTGQVVATFPLTTFLTVKAK